ncbi:hypothetical protein ACFLU3_00485 [Chloroflexota bacterium]
MLEVVPAFEVEILIDGGIVHHHMEYGMGVVEEVRQGDLLSGQTPAGLIPLFQ